MTDTADAPTTSAPETPAEPAVFSDIVVLVGFVTLVLGAVIGVVLVQPLVVLLGGTLIVALGWVMAREGG